MASAFEVKPHNVNNQLIPTPQALKLLTSPFDLKGGWLWKINLNILFLCGFLWSLRPLAKRKFHFEKLFNCFNIGWKTFLVFFRYFLRGSRKKISRAKKTRKRKVAERKLYFLFKTNLSIFKIEFSRDVCKMTENSLIFHCSRRKKKFCLDISRVVEWTVDIFTRGKLFFSLKRKRNFCSQVLRKLLNFIIL